MSTTAFPRSEASCSAPGLADPAEREVGRRLAERRLLRRCPAPPSRSAARAARRPAPTASACAPSFSRGGHVTPETMKTVVPMVDVVEQPLGVGDVHADAAVRGRVADRGVVRGAVDADARAPRGPSSACRAGCPGPGGTGFSPLAQAEFGGYHHGFAPLDDDRPAPERGRVDRLAGRDAEDALEAHALVEVEPVRAAVDDDHRAERAARHRRLQLAELEPQRRRVFAASAVKIAAIARSRRSERPACSLRDHRGAGCAAASWASAGLAVEALRATTAR